MALCITNSHLRTKSFQIHSLIPPLISLPSTTVRTVNAGTNLKQSKQADKIDHKSRGTPTNPNKHADETRSSLLHSIIKKFTVDKSKKKVLFSLRWNHKGVDIFQALLQSLIQARKPSSPIIFAREARKLEEQLGEAAMGNAFLLQGGDCNWSYEEFNANNIPDTTRVILQMSAVLMFDRRSNACYQGRKSVC